ncbi:transposase [Chryseobacterium sp. M5]|uniref:transposase n=1 Tax=Chryseobacterium sp. M5 TaxID=3379128 RepID=UPI003857C4FE
MWSIILSLYYLLQGFMKVDYKNVHIGNAIKIRVNELDIKLCDIIKEIPYSNLEELYQEKDLDAELLLTLSKLLNFDFFRIYTQHLILYSPSHAKATNKPNTYQPLYNRNLYTKEIIDFILELHSKGVKSNVQIQEDYNIPRSTLQKWITKYKKETFD